jgi:hypothetical protein
MVRSSDACTPAALAGAMVSIDTGFVHGGATYKTTFKKSYTIGSSLVEWEKCGFNIPVKDNVVSATASPLVISTVDIGDLTSTVVASGSAAVVYDNGSTELPGVGATLTGAVNGHLGRIVKRGSPATWQSYIDNGVWPNVGQRILVNSQEDAFQNGIYTIKHLGDNASKFILVRSTDSDTAARLANATVGVTAGSVNGNKLFKSDFPYGTGVVGTTNYNWVAINTDSSFKANVVVATTTNLDAIYTNGVAGNGAMLTASSVGSLPAIDGNTLGIAFIGSRILVRAQANPIHNGIYILTDVGSGSTKWEMIRAGDANSPTKLASASVSVDRGSINRGATFHCDFASSNTIGTNDIDWRAITYKTPFKESIWLATTAPFGPGVNYAVGPNPASPGEGATITNTVDGVFSLDGVSPVIGRRILVKDQVALLQNGVYILTDIGSVSSPWVLTRSWDANTPEALAGLVLSVAAGTANSGKQFATTFSVTDIIGTDPVEIYEIITSQTYTSDIRLKQNLVEIPEALEKIDKLHGYTYTMKSNGAKKAGVVAQEVQAILPEATVNLNAWTIGVDPLALIGLQMQAIKELNALVVALEERIATLEA